MGIELHRTLGNNTIAPIKTANYFYLIANSLAKGHFDSFKGSTILHKHKGGLIDWLNDRGLGNHHGIASLAIVKNLDSRKATRFEFLAGISQAGAYRNSLRGGINDTINEFNTTAENTIGKSCNSDIYSLTHSHLCSLCFCKVSNR